MHGNMYHRILSHSSAVCLGIYERHIKIFLLDVTQKSILSVCIFIAEGWICLANVEREKESSVSNPSDRQKFYKFNVSFAETQKLILKWKKNWWQFKRISIKNCLKCPTQGSCAFSTSKSNIISVMLTI